MLILHTCVDHDQRRYSIDFGVNWPKVQDSDFKVCTVAGPLIIWPTMMILHTFVCDMRWTPFDFWVKRSKVKVRFRVWTLHRFCRVTYLLTYNNDSSKYVLPITRGRFWGQNVKGGSQTLKVWICCLVVYLSFRVGLVIPEQRNCWFILVSPWLSVPLSDVRQSVEKWFLHDNSVAWWYVTRVDHDPRKTSIDFGIQRFLHHNSISFWHSMMIHWMK